MSLNEVLSSSALEQARLIRRREISSEELTRLYLSRIERLNPKLQAFVSVFSTRAIAVARRKDAAVRRGDEVPVFHGVPTAIKDLNLVRFTWTRFGTRAAIPLFLPFDDKLTQSVRRGGFVILGKLSTSEMGAMPVTEPDTHPPTRNPWDPSRSAGGSSGGSGAAVASAMLPIAPGSDGAGSIRIPSAFCHLFGFKPSRGRVVNAYGRDDRDILYSDGPMARSVEDAAALLDVLAGLDVGRPHWAPAPSRPYRETLSAPDAPLSVRFSTRSSLGPTDPDIATAVRDVALALSELGHHVEEAAFPEGSLDEFLPIWQYAVAEFPAQLWRLAQPITRWLGELGRRLKAEDVAARKRSIAARLNAELAGPDIWVTPTVAMPAPKVGAFANRPAEEAFRDAAQYGAFTAPFNITGQPAASVPIGLTRGGLPIGLQIVGRMFDDRGVLALSRQVEELRPWSGRSAPVVGE
ncbi:amidase [soil metagenome]